MNAFLFNEMIFTNAAAYRYEQEGLDNAPSQTQSQREISIHQSLLLCLGPSMSPRVSLARTPEPLDYATHLLCG